MFDQQLQDIGALVRSGMASVPDYAAQQAQQQQLAIQRQQAADQHSQFAAQQQQAQREQAEDQAFHGDLAKVMLDPNPKSISGLMLTHPAYADKIKSAWGVQDEAQKQTDLTQLGEIYSAGQAGNFDAAASVARARFDADQKAGHADPSEEAIVKALESKDPVQQKAALGMVGVHLAATTGIEHFGQVFGALGKKDQGYTLDAGATRFDADGNIVAQSPYLKGADGSILERDQAGGGGQASTATVDPGSVWSRMVGPDGKGGIEGGTNPDGSFRTSRAGALGPAQVMPGTASEAAKLAGLAYNEEKYRTDPAYNLALGKAYYSKQLSDFGDPILAAAAYNAGPGRVQSAIQKGGKTGWLSQLPAETQNYVKVAAGGASASPNGWHVLVPGKAKDAPSGYQWSTDGKSLQAIPGGPADKPGAQPNLIDPNLTGPAALASAPRGLQPVVKGLIEGRIPMPSSFAMSKPYWQNILQIAAQVDPTFDAATSAARKQAITQFTGNGKGAQMVGSVNRVAAHLGDLWNASNGLSGPDTGWGPLNTVLATGAQAFEPQAAKKYDTAVGFVAGELEKIARNSPGTEAGVSRVIQNLSRHASTTTRQAAIKEAVSIISGSLDPLKEQYTSAFRNESARPPIPWVTSKAQSIYKTINPDADVSLTGGGAQQEQGKAPSLPQGARQVGTYQGRAVYQLPNGKRLVAR